MSLAIFFLSITPAFLVLSLLFMNQQRFFQKDFGIYVLKLLFCCVFTMRIALYANGTLFTQTDLTFEVLDERIFLYTAFAGIGFNEEMAKLIPILFLLYLSDRWKTKQDVYFSCIFVGAFFAAFENLFVPHYSSLLSSLLIRSLIAVPAHLAFACVMGYFIYMLLKCSLKDNFADQRIRTGIISWFLQVVLFVKLAIFFMKPEFGTASLVEYFLKWGVLFIIGLLFLEFILLIFKLQACKWLLGWNLRLSFALLALIIPAMIHGLHDWGCSRFTGTQLLHFYLCLLFTYLTIIFFTYFTLNKQAQVKSNYITEHQ